MTRAPRRGSVAAQLIEHLSKPGAPAQIRSSEIAEMFGFEAKQITNRLAAPIARGQLLRQRCGKGYAYRLPRGAQATGACAWMAERILRIEPGAPRAPDAVEITAQWAVALGRTVTADDVAAHFGIHKTAGARRLSIAADRGLLARVEPGRKSRAVGYAAPWQRGRG